MGRFLTLRKQTTVRRLPVFLSRQHKKAAMPRGTMPYPTTLFRSGLQPSVQEKPFAYHPELDVLRFFAFLAVFLHHALPRDANFYIRGGLPGSATQWLLTAKEAGAYGVDLFFVLSSFLITEILLREHASRGKFSISAFYMRRILRIWPLYFTFLAATVLLIPNILPSERFGPIYIASFAVFLGNWACAIYGLPFSVANPLWSVSVEEQFYLGWPLLLLLFGIHRIRQLALIMLALAFGTRVFMAAYGFEHPAVWCNTLARLDPIALGAILAVSLRGRTLQISNTLRLILCGVSVAGFLLVARYLNQDGPTSVITYFVTALAGVLLLAAFLKTDFPLLRAAPFSWLVYLGRISYGLYVFHLLSLALIAKLANGALLGSFNFEARIVSSFLLTVFLAAASYRWLEQPFLRLKERFSFGSAHETGERVATQDRDVVSGVDFAKQSGRILTDTGH